MSVDIGNRIYYGLNRKRNIV